MGTPGGTADAPHIKTFWLEIAAITASVAAVIASIITVNASNNTSQTVAQYQAGAETAQSRAEFKREQRQIAYATLLAKEQALFTASNEFYGSFPAGYSLETFDELNSSQRRAVGEFDLAVSMVVILGSQDQGSGAHEAEAAASALAEKYGELSSHAASDPENGAKPFIDGAQEVATLREAFVDAAKKALDE